jgi:hypothetical protein
MLAASRKVGMMSANLRPGPVSRTTGASPLAGGSSFGRVLGTFIATRHKILKVHDLKDYPRVREVALLLLMAFAAMLVHGYHPAVEDAEIYLPGVKKLLNPTLYPYNAEFFESHAHMTVFPKLIAASIKISRLPFDWAILFWQLFAIFLLLLGCWHVGRLVFRSSRARWGGVALIASLLTIPVAGTALYIMDEYLNTRSLSTPAVLFIVVNMVERKFVRAGIWAALTAAVHPLMVVFGLCYCIFFFLVDHRSEHSLRKSALAAALLFPFGMFPPVTDAYRQALDSRSYFFLLRWQWYEWLGIFAPLVLLCWFRTIARKHQLPLLAKMSAALVLFGLAFFLAALVITVPRSFANLAELQPMRSLHLLYVLFFTFAGGLLAEFVLCEKLWRWLVLFVPLCGGMWYVQRQLFPSTPHLEWPGSDPRNDWVRAFLWVRDNTPIDAYFALDPNHLALAGEDQHGFRVLAERSRLADNVKDSGAVTMFPKLANTWLEQTRALQGWKNFTAVDFEHVKQGYGVDWVVLQTPLRANLTCPYQNLTVAVCRID